MLADARVLTALPAQDVDRALAWYAEKLELRPDQRLQDGHLFRVADGEFLLFPSSGRPSGTATQMTFLVDGDVDGVAAALRARGVEFEDIEGLDQDGGIATLGDRRGGWFTDSEGNVIGLVGPPGAG